MEQPIYGDVLFVINFSMDFLSLYLCAKLLHLAPKAWRLACAAAVGAVYGVVSLFLPLPTLLSLAVHIALSALLCMIAFSPKQPLHVIKSMALFYGIGFLLGGSMTAIYHLLNQYLYEDRIFYAGNYETVQKNVGAKSVLLLAAVSAVLVFVFGRIFLKQAKTQTATLSFCLDGRQFDLTAMVDSGNLLADSVTGTPVAFVNYDAVKADLPPAWQAFFANPTTAYLARLPYQMAKRVRILYAVGVAGEKSTLFCLRPDAVSVNGAGQKLLLAFTPPNAREFGSYTALLPSLP